MSAEGYDVCVLTRHGHTAPGEVSWNPEKQWISQDVINGALAVINLCGRSLADRRWTRPYKEKLFTSRTQPTQFLQKLCKEASHPPECYIGASGVGIYGDQGSQLIYDDSRLTGDGFIPELVTAWEDAHREIPEARNVILRMGVVLTIRGGFMERLLLPMHFGLYPYFGSGKQLMSWIHINDLTRIFLHCIRTNSIAGVYHATAPESVAQKDLMHTLREVNRGVGLLCSVPRFILRMVFGEMASMLLESADVRPDKIMRTGFQFKYPGIHAALEEVLKSK